MIALAVDLGGGHVQCAVLRDSQLLGSHTFSTDSSKGLHGLLPEIGATLRRLLDGLGIATAGCAGLAFSFCGIVDFKSGRVLSTNAKYSDAPALDLSAWARDTFGLPFAIENDARMALLGEWYAGSAREYDDIVMVTLGTGIGGAAMMGGRLLRGKHSTAGCLGGHFGARYDGRPCTCGAIGCIEAEASSRALAQICRTFASFPGSVLATLPEITFKSIFHYAETGDPTAIAVRDRCLQVWAAGTVTMIHAYDPEIVVFGGGVMNSAAAILPFIRNYVERHAWTPWGKVAIAPAGLGNDAAVFGSIPLLQELQA